MTEEIKETPIADLLITFQAKTEKEKFKIYNKVMYDVGTQVEKVYNMASIELHIFQQNLSPIEIIKNCRELNLRDSYFGIKNDKYYSFTSFSKEKFEDLVKTLQECPWYNFERAMTEMCPVVKEKIVLV